MLHKLTRVAVLAMALYGSSVRADDTEPSIFSFRGFGTVGVVHSSNDEADFTSSVFKPDGAGFSHAWSADVDSLIAAQVTANFTPQLSAVLQVVSEQNFDNSYRPHVEWANIKYQFTPDFSVRVGRTVLPAFLLSESRRIGYTYPWVRPPFDAYRLLPVTSTDGVDVSYRLHAGELANTVQANAGQNGSRFPNDMGTAKSRNLWGISNTTEYGPLTARITYEKSDVTVAFVDPLFDAFRQFGPQGIAIADKYNSNNKPIAFLAVGASYDPGDWFVMSEWGRIEPHSFVGRQTVWYLSGGYRLGKFMPYAAYAQSKADDLSDPGLDISTLPPFLIDPAIGLNAALNVVLSKRPVQNTLSIGVRWDFIKNTALKLQFDHTRTGKGSVGAFTNTQPGFELGSKVNVLSATIDFVF